MRLKKGIIWPFDVMHNSCCKVHTSLRNVKISGHSITSSFLILEATVRKSELQFSSSGQKYNQDAAKNQICFVQRKNGGCPPNKDYLQACLLITRFNFDITKALIILPRRAESLCWLLVSLYYSSWFQTIGCYVFCQQRFIITGVVNIWSLVLSVDFKQPNRSWPTVV